MLRRAGYDDVTVFERGERVGGVWHHNTYPGAACDVPSHLYEFSFEPNPRWSRRYAPQAEIQAYLEDVARRHGVLDRIRTEHRGDARALGRGARQVGARDERRRARGRRADHRVRPAVGAEACRRSPASTSFDGPAFHTARWRARRRARRQAGGRGRDRLQRDPGRAGDPADRRARRRLPALAGLDAPEDGLRLQGAHASACSSASRCSSASTARRSSPSWSSAAAGMTEPPLAAGAVPRARAAADQQGDQGPRAARAR